MDPAVLLEAAHRLAPPESGYALVYGSGLDIKPDLLEALSAGRKVYGNAPETLRLLKSPRCFFGLLDRLAIPYPETRFDPPADPWGWLVKPSCGEGGKGVGFCAQAAPPGAELYYQRQLPEPPMSALFLADGENARIIGFNTLWTARLPGQPFLYAGAINRAELGPDQQAQIADAIARLTQATGLRGLNSLDFMRDSALCRALEINPRPSATLSLYDADFPEGLLARHIRACRGNLGPPWQAGATIRASKAVFARRGSTIPTGFSWPAGCCDRPMPGESIAAGQPICTVEAEGQSHQEVESLIRLREASLLAQIEGEDS